MGVANAKTPFKKMRLEALERHLARAVNLPFRRKGGKRNDIGGSAHKGVADVASNPCTVWWRTCNVSCMDCFTIGVLPNVTTWSNVGTVNVTDVARAPRFH